VYHSGLDQCEYYCTGDPTTGQAGASSTEGTRFGGGVAAGSIGTLGSISTKCPAAGSADLAMSACNRQYVRCWDGQAHIAYCRDGEAFDPVVGGICRFHQYVLLCSGRPYLNSGPAHSSHHANVRPGPQYPPESISIPNTQGHEAMPGSGSITVLNSQGHHIMAGPQGNPKNFSVLNSEERYTTPDPTEIRNGFDSQNANEKSEDTARQHGHTASTIKDSSMGQSKAQPLCSPTGEYLVGFRPCDPRYLHCRNGILRQLICPDHQVFVAEGKGPQRGRGLCWDRDLAPSCGLNSASSVHADVIVEQTYQCPPSTGVTTYRTFGPCDPHYIRCQAGTTTNLYCPSGQIFDPRSSLCKPREEVDKDCVGASWGQSTTDDIRCPAHGYAEVSVARCSQRFLRCENGRSSESECPKGQVFVRGHGCRKKETETSCASPSVDSRCPEESTGDYPLERCASFFLRCWAGSGTVVPCITAREVFDPQVKACRQRQLVSGCATRDSKYSTSSRSKAVRPDGSPLHGAQTVRIPEIANRNWLFRRAPNGYRQLLPPYEWSETVPKNGQLEPYNWSKLFAKPTHSFRSPPSETLKQLLESVQNAYNGPRTLHDTNAHNIANRLKAMSHVHGSSAFNGLLQQVMNGGMTTHYSGQWSDEATPEIPYDAAYKRLLNFVLNAFNNQTNRDHSKYNYNQLNAHIFGNANHYTLDPWTPNGYHSWNPNTAPWDRQTTPDTPAGFDNHLTSKNGFSWLSYPDTDLAGFCRENKDGLFTSANCDRNILLCIKGRTIPFACPIGYAMDLDKYVCVPRYLCVPSGPKSGNAPEWHRVVPHCDAGAPDLYAVDSCRLPLYFKCSVQRPVLLGICDVTRGEVFKLDDDRSSTGGKCVDRRECRKDEQESICSGRPDGVFAIRSCWRYFAVCVQGIHQYRYCGLRTHVFSEAEGRCVPARTCRRSTPSTFGYARHDLFCLRRPTGAYAIQPCGYLFATCANGRFQLRNCGRKTHRFSAAEGRCVPAGYCIRLKWTVDQGETINPCQYRRNNLYAIAHCINKYLQCINGRATYKTCAKGDAFDEQSQQCLPLAHCAGNQNEHLQPI
jgi:hypothetical protein